MTCFYPRTVWRAKELNENGKRPIVFNPDKGLDNSEMKIPCGQCMGCRITYGTSWAIRLMHEFKNHSCASFLTLTYAPEHLPENGVLVKGHLQAFIRRVRKEFPAVQVRYFGVGEYGEKGGRPHYHVILFGVNFHEDWKFHSNNKYGDPKYTSPTLARLWGKGHCEIGQVTFKSCAYVAGYALKKVNGKLAASHYARVNAQTGECYTLPKEFALMSRRPGIGESHYRKYGKQMYVRDSVIDRGRELPIPRYYDKLLERDDPLRLEDVKLGRFERSQRHKSDQTPERLAVRAEVLAAKRREFNKKEL